MPSLTELFLAAMHAYKPFESNSIEALKERTITDITLPEIPGRIEWIDFFALAYECPIEKQLEKRTTGRLITYVWVITRANDGS